MELGVYGTDTQVFLETPEMLPERHAKIQLFKHFFLSLFFLPSPPFFFFPFCRFDRIAHTRETMNSDGLNTLSYKVLRTDKYPLYTKITVDIGSPNS